MKNDYRVEDLIPIVAELTDKYTSKESTSIPYEKARQLMEAVLYCLNENEQLLDYSKSSLSVTEGSRLTAKEAYDRGYQLLIIKVKQLLELYNETSRNFKDYGLRCYFDTFIKGIPAFIQHYDAKFNPQNHILTLDYPTIKPLYDYCGVDVIYLYVSYIQLEQIFLSAYPEEYVIEILIRFHEEYEELFINVCSIVLRNILGNMLIGKQLINRGFTEIHYNNIRVIVSSCSRLELKERLIKLLKILIKDAYNDNQMLFEYLVEDMEDFVVELQNVVKNNCLERLLLI